MRTRVLFALLLAVATAVAAQDAPAPKPMTIAVEPLGDSNGNVVARVSFRFATPAEAPEEVGMVLQGSFLRGGEVLRNFRYDLPPGRRDAISSVQSFSPGELEVEARLILSLDDAAPAIVAKTTQKFTLVPTGHPYVAAATDGADAIFAEGVVPETVGAVRIRSPRRDVAPNLFIVEVDVLPPVKRVEFWVEGKKVMARNAPPYTVELDLGKLPKRVEVRAVGYDQGGRYVDADAFMVSERETPLEAKLTRTETPDGLSHFKLSIQNPKNTAIRTVTLYAGQEKLYQWTRPPYALDVATSKLSGKEFVRASVIDETGYEATDLLFLDGARYTEEIEVNSVGLPVSVSDASGAAITGLTRKDFTVLENGKPQTLTSFSFASDLPISVGVLLDHSGSMEKRMSDAKVAAIEFFRRIIKPNDRAFISGFASDPARGAPFVADVASLEAQVTAVADAGGGTALYDAIVTGLYRFRGVEGRKALIVITDGDDTTSRLSYDEMLAYARAARVPLYFVGIGFGLGDFGGPPKMRALAAETGGVAYFVRNVGQLAEAYRKLEADLRSQYLLSYNTESSKKDDAYRTIEVKVAREGAKVRTIRGFIP